MAEFIKVDALGDACPLPVVKAKKAISELQGAGQVEVLVDNEIAVQNLTKMAQQKGYQYSAEKLEIRMRLPKGMQRYELIEKLEHTAFVAEVSD